MPRSSAVPIPYLQQYGNLSPYHLRADASVQLAARDLPHGLHGVFADCLPDGDWIHFDVMDNHYVPNLTFGPMICEALRPHARLPDGQSAPIDVHLMVQLVDALAATLDRKSNV